MYWKHKNIIFLKRIFFKNINLLETKGVCFNKIHVLQSVSFYRIMLLQKKHITCRGSYGQVLKKRVWDFNTFQIRSIYYAKLNSWTPMFMHICISEKIILSINCTFTWRLVWVFHRFGILLIIEKAYLFWISLYVQHISDQCQFYTFINSYLFMEKWHHKSNWSISLIHKHSPQNL